MKTLLVVGTLLMGVSGQALSMGHPHNLFAARKQMKAKASVVAHRPKVTSVVSCWQPVVKIDKSAWSKRLLAALSAIRPAQAD
ncbi:hypothetical protein HNV11_22190 [Spirosoma taeanense]|uniref:Uncharacterized protein n=1 Tax=Spirosoma taeanense TaxID=2735870 RepID=A0A6M5YCW8_9BACT|nr:hypothetical protein [Spirosoma taeanense]QJW91897.1 hypothetical protein HNV11_22190 [Spirosoma taeanense]